MSFRTVLFAACLIVAPLAAAPGVAAQDASTAPTIEQMEKTWTDHTFTAADGTVIHYYEQGQGVPVILIHGLGSSGLGNWFRTGVAQEVAKTNRVIAIDMRGHGQTGAPAEGASGYMINDIVQLMDHLGVEKAHIAGYSMGGATTAGLLREAPERFITGGLLGIGVTNAPGASGPEGGAGGVPDLGSTGMRAPRGAPAPSQRVDLAAIDFPVIAINGANDNPGKTEPMWRYLKNFTNIVIPERNHMNASFDPIMAAEYHSFVMEHNPG